MGKKKASGKTYVSKGERRNVARATTKAMRRARTPMDRALNQLRAHMKGKRTKLTKDETKNTGVFVRGQREE